MDAFSALKRKLPHFARPGFFLGCLGLLLVGSAFFSACSSSKSEEPKARPAVPVTVAPVVQKSVPIQIRTIGNVEAYSTVSIKAQVGGTLTGVHFKEGQDVKKGDLLFTIDARPFEEDLKRAEANLAKDIAQVKQAQANLAREVAQLKNAEVETRRFADLIKQGIATQHDYDQAATNAEALRAAVGADKAAIENAEAVIRADKAAVENAKLSLAYCSIRSPVDGRTGSLMVNQGNLIKANDVPLVVINQISPIYVNISIPEKDLSQIKKYMSAGKLAVEALVPWRRGEVRSRLPQLCGQRRGPLHWDHPAQGNLWQSREAAMARTIRPGGPDFGHTARRRSGTSPGSSGRAEGTVCLRGQARSLRGSAVRGRRCYAQRGDRDRERAAAWRERGNRRSASTRSRR